jgi:GMP synthase-like glutamine amidotransferase
MRPVAVFQNTENDGPALFEAFARTRGLPLQVHRLYARDALPANVQAFSGLCILGSPASANDEIPEFRALEQLIVQARQARIPVIGHCFGGQILAKALGGRITPSQNAEIGWSSIQSAALDWFGATQFPMFQWHFETFSIPAGSDLLATGSMCPNQAFCVDDIHLGMQFHCEADLPKIEGWLDATGCTEITRKPSPGVQDPETIRAITQARLHESMQVARTIYERWSNALRA